MEKPPEGGFLSLLPQRLNVAISGALSKFAYRHRFGANENVKPSARGCPEVSCGADRRVTKPEPKADGMHRTAFLTHLTA
jgi:hypothetical protein